MDASKWERVKRLFGSALEREAAQRGAFLAEACRGDRSLLQEVESLLAAHQDAATTLGGIGLGGSAAGKPASENLISGRRIGPYQVIRRLGQGGMAAVYLAVRADDQYKKRVAIKLILPGLDSEELLRRLRNERQTLAALDHSHIVKLLDGGTTEDGLPYLVMDYVEGTPLDDYCDHHKLSTDERLRLFLTVCAAVSYAHQRLVIHRDLKPDNILVTADGTPKLLDFGIAKLLNPEALATLVVTRTGQRAMTPEYASPEQVRGEPLTNATDIYSLGVVLYELLTGHRLYRLKTHAMAEMERAICEEEPLKPSTVVTRAEQETLPDGTTKTTTAEEISRVRVADPKKLRNRLHGDLDAIVMMALRKEPQRRYASVHDFAEDIRRHLEGLPVKARPSTFWYRGTKFVRRHKEGAAAMVVFLLLLTIAVAFYVVSHTRAGNYRVAPVKGRRSVAVLGFKNLTGKPEAGWLSIALSEMLTTELAAGEKLRTVPGESVARMKVDLALPDTDSLAPDTLAKIHRNLGSDLVVLGSYLDITGQVRLDVHLEDANTGEMLAAVSDTGTEQQLLDLVNHAGTELRRKCGAGEITTEQAKEIKASAPSNPKATRLYSEGLSKLRFFDSVSARDTLEKAVVADPDFALGHSALAQAWSALGYDLRAQDEAKKALDLSGSLAWQDRLSIEARYREIIHQYDKAIELYGELWRSLPDNLEYGLDLARAQTLGSKPGDALATIEGLRRLPPPARDDARIDIGEARATEMIGDNKRMQEAAARAIQKAQVQGARLLVAQGHRWECEALGNLSEFSRAIASCEEGISIYTEAGDSVSVANTFDGLSFVRLNQGDFAGALRAADEELAICKRIGNRLGAASAYSAIGSIQGAQGELHASEENERRAIAIYDELGKLNNLERSLANVASGILDNSPAAALAPAQRSVTIAAQVGDKSSQAVSLNVLGSAHYFLGNLSQAQEEYDRSLHLARETKEPVFEAFVLRLQGDLIAAQGETSAAWHKYQEAVKIQNQTGQRNYGAQTHLSLDALLIDAGDFNSAEKDSREALEEFQKDGDADDGVWARAILVQALTGERKFVDAERQIHIGALAAAKDENRVNPFLFNIAASELYAATGKALKAEKLLKATLTEATKYSFVPYQFEARLALGNLEIKSGRSAAGRAHLAALEKDATAKGFLLIARKAASAAKG